MLFYHYTHKDNLPSIQRDGLRVDKARSVKRVWLCNAPKRAWALRHVADSHGWRLLDMVCVAVDVPRSWCARWRWGVYLCNRDIGPGRVRRVKPA
jgi:hypothetical protein